MPASRRRSREKRRCRRERLEGVENALSGALGVIQSQYLARSRISTVAFSSHGPDTVVRRPCTIDWTRDTG